MKHSIFALLIAVLGGASLMQSATAQEPERGRPSAELQNFVRNSYIFQLDESLARGRIPARAAELARGAGGALGFVYTTAYRGFSAQITSVAADNLFRNNDDVIGYSRDGIVTIVQASPKKGPPPHAGGGDKETVPAGQTTPWGIARVGGAGAGSGKTAWIIDTGIDLDHPDLKVDVSKSANFVWKGKNSPDDGHGHGTHVAGTIAAIDNELDVVGVAAGASVVAVRVLDNSGSGSYSGVIAGVDYVAANASPGDVANMSLGGPPYAALDTAILNAAKGGVKFAIAAGNSGDDANKYSPARVNHTNVYTVSAIDAGDRLTSWSNWGNPPVDYAAPGLGILSLKKGGGTTTMSGTSMAAPHVAGILMLGNVGSDGSAGADSDGTADPIAHR